ncbi:MAG: asparagine synthase-related protein [Candidatus Heimdallarchaeaceae archaeon]
MTEFLFAFSKNSNLSLNINKLESTLNKSMRNPIIDKISFEHIKCVIASFVKGYPSIKNNENEVEIIFDNYSKELEHKTYAFGFRNSERIIFNKESLKVKIITSTWGLTHLYICSPNPGVLIISSNFKNIFSLYPDIRRKLNYDSIIEYLFSHTIFGIKTYFYDVLLCPPNSEISINLETVNKDLKNSLSNAKKQIKVLNYSKDADFNTISEYLAKRIKDTLKCLYEKYSDTQFNLMLSGGLDSRTLAAAIPKPYRKKTKALTFDTEIKGKEIIKAQKIANKLNLKHITQIYTYEDILSFKEFHTWLSEGSSYITVASIHPLLDKTESGFVVEGYLGDTQFGGEFLGTVDMNLESVERSNLIDFFIKVNEDIGYSFPLDVFADFFKNRDLKEIIEIISNGYKSLFDLMWDSNDVLMLIECALYFTRGRRVTIGGSRAIEYYSNDVKPFYDSGFISKVLLLHPKYRIKRKLEIEVLRKLNKDIGLLSSTSTSIYHKLPRLRKYVLSVINFLERITRKQINPYYSKNSARFWMRNKNHPYTKWIFERILNPSNLIFKFVDYQSTKQMFEEYTKYRSNYFKNTTQFLDLELYFQIIYGRSKKEFKLPEIEKIKIISDVLKFEKTMNNPYL